MFICSKTNARVVIRVDFKMNDEHFTHIIRMHVAVYSHYIMVCFNRNISIDIYIKVYII